MGWLNYRLGYGVHGTVDGDNPNVPPQVFNYGSNDTCVSYEDATYTYYCFAAAGSSTSASVWKIKRVLKSGVGNLLTWANGNPSYSYVAANYASYTYS